MCRRLLDLAGGGAPGMPGAVGLRMRYGACRRSLGDDPPQIGHIYVEEGIWFPGGHCRAFDAGANGTVRGMAWDGGCSSAFRRHWRRRPFMRS